MSHQKHDVGMDPLAMRDFHPASPDAMACDRVLREYGVWNVDAPARVANGAEAMAAEIVALRAEALRWKQLAGANQALFEERSDQLQAETERADRLERMADTLADLAADVPILRAEIATLRAALEGAP